MAISNQYEATKVAGEMVKEALGANAIKLLGSSASVEESVSRAAIDAAYITTLVQKVAAGLMKD